MFGDKMVSGTVCKVGRFRTLILLITSMFSGYLEHEPLSGNPFQGTDADQSRLQVSFQLACPNGRMLCLWKCSNIVQS